MLRRICFAVAVCALLGASGSVEDFPRAPLGVHARLYEQLALIHSVCKQHNIKYWLIGGSLLGQVRGEFLTGKGEIIPWDDDADIGIDLADKARFLEAMAPEAKKYDMAVHNSSHGYKLKCLRTSGVGTDVFVYKKVDTYDNPAVKPEDNKDVWILGTAVSNKAWPRDFFLSSELQNLATVKFGPIEVMIPSPALRYLKVGYGEDCMNTARLGYSHAQNKPHANAGATAVLTKSTPEGKPEL